MEFTNEHLEKLVETEQRSKSNTKRLDGLEQKQEEVSDLAKAIVAMNERQSNISKDLTETKSDVKEIASDVKELKSKPGKRWEAVVEKIVLAIVAAVVAYFLTRAGMS